MTRKPPVIDPLAPEIERLLAADRAVAPLTSEVEARIQQRIISTLELPIADLGAGDVVEGGSPTETSDMLAETLSETGGIVSKLSALKTIAVFVTGIATGAVGHAVYESASADRDSEKENSTMQIRQASTDNPEHSLMSDSDSLIDASTAAPETPISILPTKTGIETIGKKTRQEKPQSRIVITEKVEKKRIEQERTRVLSAEQKLIEMAQSALARGRPQDALRALRKHQTTFSQGELKEEREALTIMALVKIGKRQSAEMLFTQFRKRYPRSMFNRTIAEALK